MIEATKIQSPDLGLTDDAMTGAVNILSTLLADEFLLRLKLRKFHWNVTGPQFLSLHEMFEEQYTALTVFIDEVAERLRTYGVMSPGTMSEFTDLTRLEEHPAENPDAEGMIQALVDDHEKMVRYLREDIDVADDYDDYGLEDFLTAQLQEHQEMAWMLRSFLERSRTVS